MLDLTKDLPKQLNNLPTCAGVYIYSDKDGNILYVGKAKNLKNRIKQYFAKNQNQRKVTVMLSHATNLRYIVVDNGSEALSLENTLIKKHKPPYNILLKDDKQYSYIKVNLQSDYPKLIFTRKVEKDGCKYFGPFTAGGGRLIDLVRFVYPTIICNHNFDKLPKSFRPCLNADLGLCVAPCVNKGVREEYLQNVADSLDLLAGNYGKARTILTEKMNKYAENLHFEQAQECKDYLQMLSFFQRKHTVVQTKLVNYDVFSIAGNGVSCACNVMLVRNGRVMSSQNFALNDGGIDDEQTLSGFILSYYNTEVPSSTVLTALEITDCDALAQIILDAGGAKTKIEYPKKGIKKSLTDLSYKNATEYLEKSTTAVYKQYNTTRGAVAQLKELLNLSFYPNRIECYDISNVSGVDKVASMVVFTDGEQDSKSYRRFKIKTVEGADDFASMKEVIARRIGRIKEGDLAFGEKPDLIVVDGGLGQLSSAYSAMQEQGLTIPLISLAKKQEIVYTLTNHEGYRLPLNSYALRLLINIRDEAHRFAITYFRSLHNKNSLKSELSKIEGVGEKRQIALIKHFTNMENISSATTEQIAQVEGINYKTAEEVYKHFNG